MAVTGWTVALLALGVVPLVTTGDDRVLLGWIALVAVLVALDVLLAASPRALRLRRELPAAVRLGESTASRLVVVNDGRRRLRGVLRDAWQPSAGAASTRRPLSLRPGRAVTVRSIGPLRLAGRQATVELPGVVRVLPRFSSRRHLPSRLARLRELDGRTSVMVRGQGTEFDSLREYVRGDDVRSIDWRATARRDGLVVRTWRPERDRRIVVVVDSGRTSAARVDDEPRLDTAFESALLLAALASRAGDRVDVVVFDRRVRGRVQGATGAALLSSLVDVLAPVEPELVDTDWSSVPALVRSVTSQRALVVLATTVDSPGSARSLLAAVPQLSRQHLVVVASVADPALAETALRRDGRSEVYRAAAAERAVLDASRVAAALRQVAADVVSAAPADLPPALADRYLALKAAGRL
jgi:uncharacterized protein (DUF58 family)